MVTILYIFTSPILPTSDWGCMGNYVDSGIIENEEIPALCKRIIEDYSLDKIVLKGIHGYNEKFAREIEAVCDLSKTELEY